ncbi:MAG: transglutaminase-like domain-containing protein [Clostridiales bacterium]|nr:transglutaminase-like domain-containing protein [Clostridiales bacterium]
MKKSYRNYFFMFILMAFILIAGFSTSIMTETAEAATTTSTEVPVMTGATTVNASKIKVSWKVSNPDGVYIIYRKNSGSSYKAIGYVMASSSKSYSYNDTTVISGVKYTYTVANVPSSQLVECFCYSQVYYTSTDTKTYYFYAPSNVSVLRYILVTSDGEIVANSSTTELSYVLGSRSKSCTVYAIVKGTQGSYNTAGVSAKTTLPASKVTSTSLVATKKIRINYKRSTGATSYEIYRRTKGSKKWKKIATVIGEKNLYCYDKSVSAKKTYYYTVKAYVKQNSTKSYASYNKTGTKAYYKSVTVNPKSSSNTSIYGYNLSASKKAAVKKAVKKFCKKYITSDMSTLEKLMVIQLYLSETCVYDASGSNAHNAWGALVQKDSKGKHHIVCEGYSRAFKAICDGLGISCKCIVDNNSYHMWVQVKVKGKWYIIDPTCNTTTNFKWFLISSSTFKNFWLTGSNPHRLVWKLSSYPKLSKSDFSGTKIQKAFEGYKVQLVVKKLFDSSYTGITRYR